MTSRAGLQRSLCARAVRWALPTMLAGPAAIAVARGPDLPTGIVAAPTAATAALAWCGVVWAIVLLLFGARLDRATMGTQLLAVGSALGWFVAAEHSLALVLAGALLVTAVGLAVYLWVPRLAMAVSMAWPLAALYAAHLWFSGSFGFSRGRALVLVAVGVVLGAIAPRRSLPLLSAALGTVLLFGAGPFEPTMTRVLGVMVSSVVWQVVLLRVWRSRPRPAGEEAPVPTKVRLWARSAQWASGVAVAALVWVAVAAPMYGPDTVANPARMERLVRDGELDRPGLVLFAPSNLYLSGQPLPVAVVERRVGPWTRIRLPFVGRSPGRAVRRMRVVKSEAELDAMRRAAQITSLAFSDVWPFIRPGVSEAEIARRIVDSYVEHGATGIAFPSIVGSGANATLPHYDANSAVLSDGLVVIDIGCSFDGYASDMTRTFSVTGEYTMAQKHLIETVIAAGDAARAALGPGTSMREVRAAAREVIDAAGFGPYFNHAIGHHVGLQVHDPRRDPLEPGMVITIEPGIYVPEGAKTDPSYWNLGVRIEDSYVVTESGWEEITDYPRRPYTG